MDSFNLGNVAGIVRGENPPLEADGVTVKTYVLWAKIISTNPLAYDVHYFDITQNGWISIDSVKQQISAIINQIGDTANLQTSVTTNLVDAINSLVSNLGVVIDDVNPAADKTFSSNRINELLTQLSASIIGGATTNFNTLEKIEQEIGQINVALDSIVRSDGAQTFSAGQKAQINANIGSVSAEQFGDQATDLVVAFTTAMNNVTPTIT